MQKALPKAKAKICLNPWLSVVSVFPLMSLYTKNVREALKSRDRCAIVVRKQAAKLQQLIL